MKLPQWFWIGMAAWALLGLPGLVLGAMWDGRIELADLIGDPPPYFQFPYEDRSFWANAAWVFATVMVHLPIFLGLALLINRRRPRKKIDA